MRCSECSFTVPRDVDYRIQILENRRAAGDAAGYLQLNGNVVL